MPILENVNDEPRLTVVVPVFNGSTYLHETLVSLEELEKLLSCELIFQDNLSTDGTSGIIERFCSGRKNRFHFNEKDSGQSDAINAGMRRAKGKWVTWLCADDILLPDLASAIKDAEQAGADIVYGDIIFLQQGKIFPAIGTEAHQDGSLAGRRLIIQQPGTCLLKEVWDEFGGVRPNLNWSMDYDLFMRLESGKKIFFRTTYFVAVIRVHKDAKTSSGSVRRMLELWRIILESHLRRPGYFRIRPYAVYGIEYIIKAMESNEGLKTKFPLRFFIRFLHKFFWLVASPREKIYIVDRFKNLSQGIGDFLKRQSDPVVFNKSTVRKSGAVSEGN